MNSAVMKSVTNNTEHAQAGAPNRIGHWASDADLPKAGRMISVSGCMTPVGREKPTVSFAAKAHTIPNTAAGADVQRDHSHRMSEGRQRYKRSTATAVR